MPDGTTRFDLSVSRISGGRHERFLLSSFFTRSSTLQSRSKACTQLFSLKYLIILKQSYPSPYRSWSSGVASLPRQWRQQMLLFQSRLPPHDHRRPHPPALKCRHLEQVITVKDVRQFLELLKILQSTKKEPGKIQTTAFVPEKDFPPAEPRVHASRLGFKTVAHNQADTAITQLERKDKPV